MALPNLSSCPKDGYNVLMIVGNGGRSPNWEEPDLDVVIVMTQWGYTSRLGGPSAPGELVERFLLVSSTGVEGWTKLVQSEAENDVMGRERGVWRAPCTPLSALNRDCFRFDVPMVQRWIWLV